MTLRMSLISVPDSFSDITRPRDTGATVVWPTCFTTCGWTSVPPFTIAE